MRTWEEVGIDPSLLRNPNGENKIPCPKCRPTSKHPDRRCLNVNTAKGEWNCWDNGEGCGFKGSLRGGRAAPDDFDGPTGEVVTPTRTREVRQITKEEYLRKTQPLSDEARAWLHERGFSDETIRGVGLRSCFVTKEGDRWIKGIAYPYLVKRGDAVSIANIKKRCICPRKEDGARCDHMQLVGGAELVFYGLTNVADTTIVVEGECDAIAYYQAGITNVISVPNGATLKADATKLSYLDACKAEIDGVKHLIMSTDDDQPGRLLKHELARRIGFGKCSYVTYPEGCNDANDVLLKHGPEALHRMVKEAKPFPTKGLTRPEDMLDQLLEWQQDGMPSGFTTGWPELDAYYRPVPGQLNIVTGIPSHGKSEFVDALTLHLWHENDWPVLFYSPENFPPDVHMVKLAEKEVGKTFDPEVLEKWRRLGCDGELMSPDETRETVARLQRGFTFILPEPDGDGYNLDQLLELARQEVYRYGVKVFVIDPWNEIEHHIPRHMQKTDYIGLCLSKIRRFARLHEVVVYVVAHPTKLDRRPERFKDAAGVETILHVEPVPTAYDIADSANWYNKADNILTVWRDKYAEARGNDPHVNSIYVQKIKLKWAGMLGVVQFRWDPPTGRYLSLKDRASAPRPPADLAAINQALGDDW